MNTATCKNVVQQPSKNSSPNGVIECVVNAYHAGNISNIGTFSENIEYIIQTILKG